MRGQRGWWDMESKRVFVWVRSPQHSSPACARTQRVLVFRCSLVYRHQLFIVTHIESPQCRVAAMCFVTCCLAGGFSGSQAPAMGRSISDGGMPSLAASLAVAGAAAIPWGAGVVGLSAPLPATATPSGGRGTGDSGTWPHFASQLPVWSACFRLCVRVLLSPFALPCAQRDCLCTCRLRLLACRHWVRMRTFALRRAGSSSLSCAPAPSPTPSSRHTHPHHTHKHAYIRHTHICHTSHTHTVRL